MNWNKDLEIEISEDSETTTTTNEESLSSQNKSVINIKEKKINSKSKLCCIFNKKWLKDPQYASFLRECQINKYLAHCSICKSNFSIANGGVYLINHKRLAETQAKKNSRLLHDFLPPSSTLTELTVVYHGIRHGHSYVSQSCMVDVLKKIFDESQIGKKITCGKTKARELAEHVLESIHTRY